MDTETKNSIEALLDDATDGIEQAREALRQASKRVREAGKSELAAALNWQSLSLGVASNLIGALKVEG